MYRDIRPNLKTLMIFDVKTLHINIKKAEAKIVFLVKKSILVQNFGSQRSFSEILCHFFLIWGVLTPEDIAL